MTAGDLYRHVSTSLVDTRPDKSPMAMTSVMGNVKAKRYTTSLVVFSNHHHRLRLKLRSTTMLDRRGFVSGAIFTTIGLALSPGQADAQKSPGDALKFLAKTEYPGDKYACV